MRSPRRRSASTSRDQCRHHQNNAMASLASAYKRRAVSTCPDVAHERDDARESVRRIDVSLDYIKREVVRPAERPHRDHEQRAGHECGLPNDHQARSGSAGNYEQRRFQVHQPRTGQRLHILSTSDRAWSRWPVRSWETPRMEPRGKVRPSQSKVRPRKSMVEP